jgi:hypothetical protein
MELLKNFKVKKLSHNQKHYVAFALNFQSFSSFFTQSALKSAIRGKVKTLFPLES